MQHSVGYSLQDVFLSLKFVLYHSFEKSSNCAKMQLLQSWLQLQCLLSLKINPLWANDRLGINYNEIFAARVLREICNVWKCKLSRELLAVNAKSLFEFEWCTNNLKYCQIFSFSFFTFTESPDIMVKMASNDAFEHVFKVHCWIFIVYSRNIAWNKLAHLMIISHALIFQNIHAAASVVSHLRFSDNFSCFLCARIWFWLCNLNDKCWKLMVIHCAF